MVRTKKVSKGSRSSTRSSTRASTRKTSTISRSSAVSSAASTCDSDGFAVPAPVIPTLDSLHRDIEEQYDSLRKELDNQHQRQLKTIQMAFVRHKVRIGNTLYKPIIELLLGYQPPEPASKIPASAQKTMLVNSNIMQDRTNMQLVPKNVLVKTSAQDKTLFKQPTKVANTSKLLLQQPPQQASSSNKFVTPINRPVPNTPAITPKVDINAPLSIIRRPRAGEFAMSVEGSPLMVSAIPRDEIPSVCVPLADGTVLSILPNTGISAEQLPYLSEDLKAQLETLQSNLKFITGSK